MIYFKRIILILMLSITSVLGEPPAGKIKGLHKLVKPEYSQSSLLWGFLALETQIIENIRILGNYGKFDKVHPVIPRTNQSLKDTDSPQDWVTAFIQYLFPSSGLVGLVVSTRPSDFTYKMDIAAVGRVMQVIATTDHSNKQLLTGEILKALDIKVYNKLHDDIVGKYLTEKYKELPKYEPILTNEELVSINNKINTALNKIKLEGEARQKKFDNLLKNAKKKLIKQKLNAYIKATKKELKNTFTDEDRTEVINRIFDSIQSWKNKKKNSEKPHIIAYLIIEALLESKQKDSTYPPHIVEAALTAWVWKKTSSKKELMAYYKAIPKLLSDTINLDELSNNKDFLADAYNKDEYLTFKDKINKSNKSDLIQQLKDNPEFAAYIGIGHFIFDAKLPPKLNYGIAKHPILAGGTFPDCGSTSLRSFFEMLLFDPKHNKLDITKLAEKFSIDIENMSKEIPDLSDKNAGIKRLLWFFSKYPKPDKSQAARNDWALITSQWPGVIYLKGPGGSKVCEIEAGLSNMLKVIAKLIPDPKLTSKKTDVNEANAEILTNLCELFNTDTKTFKWQTTAGNQKLQDNVNVNLEFLINNQPAFTWSFSSGHFELIPTISAGSYWQLWLQDDLAPAYKQGLHTYLMPFYANPEKFEQLIKSNPNLAWPLIYGDLENESTKKLAITHIFKNNQRGLYPIAWRWMNQMPTTDTRIQQFILDRLLMDKAWYDALPDTNPIKQQAEGYLLSINDDDKNHWLITASREYHLNMVQKLLDHGADVNAKDHGNSTPLHYASKNGNLNMVQELLDHGADVGAENHSNSTPLYKASKNGHLEVVKELITHNADVKAKNKNQFTPLHRAASKGYLEIVKLLIAHRANVNAENKFQYTPLHYASASAHLEVVRLLIKHGADVNAKDHDNSTPLNNASKGHLEVVKLLIAHGADINTKTKNQYTPLHNASKGHLEVVKLLIAHGADINAKSHDNSTPLHYASENGHLEVVKELIAHGADVKAEGYGQDTPLHAASKNGHLEVVKELIAHGADVKAKTTYKNTPLHNAASKGYLEVVKLLIAHGADVKAKTTYKGTPLHYASENGHLEVIKFLIEEGADVKAKGINKDTPLHNASHNGHLEVVKELIKEGAEINSLNSFNSAPLHNALQQNHLRVAEELIKRGADVNLKGRINNTALHYVTKDSSPEHLRTLKLLIKSNANINTADNRKYTPLHTAAFLGGLDIVKELVENGADIRLRNKNGKTPLQISQAKTYLQNVTDHFKYPSKDKTAIEYLDSLVELRQTTTLPPRLLTYWANQTLSGSSYGVRSGDNPYPTKIELEKILKAIAMSASGVKYDKDDDWMAWSIFKNDNDPNEHKKNIYTFIRYAQMRYAKIAEDKIFDTLKNNTLTNNALTVRTYGNVKQQFDKIIDDNKFPDGIG